MAFTPNINNARLYTRAHLNPYPQQTAEFSDEPLLRTYLGTPIYDNLILLPENTGLQSGITDPVTGLDKNAIVLNDALITISNTKNIVKTPINGRNGTVKEYISLGDYMIDVRGFIISENPNEWPLEQIDFFEQFANLEQQISVASKLLDAFRVRSIVIETYNVAQQAGYRNRVPFTMQCLSDEDIELQLSSDANSTQ